MSISGGLLIFSAYTLTSKQGHFNSYDAMGLSKLSMTLANHRTWVILPTMVPDWTCDLIQGPLHSGSQCPQVQYDNVESNTPMSH